MSGGGSPLVSVIVPTRNRPAELGEALASIGEQRGIAAELVQVVVVNDGGSDVTDSVTSARRDGMRVTAVTHPHRRGLSSARNTGLDLAQGRYVALLDDDDVFLPDHLATAMAHLDQPDLCDATVATCLVSDRRTTGHQPPAEAERWDLVFDPDLLTVSNLLPVHAAVLRRPPRAARFDAALSALEDWDFWLRLTHEHGYRFTRIPQATAVYHRVTDASTMLNTMVDGARPAAEFSVLVRRIWRRWPAADPRAARFRAYIATMYWQLLSALATGTAPNPHYYLHSVRAITEAWTNPPSEAALMERLAHTVTGDPHDVAHAA